MSYLHFKALQNSNILLEQDHISHRETASPHIWGAKITVINLSIKI